jgi:hypothetical protein
MSDTSFAPKWTPPYKIEMNPSEGEFGTSIDIHDIVRQEFDFSKVLEQSDFGSRSALDDYICGWFGASGSRQVARNVGELNLPTIAAVLGRITNQASSEAATKLDQVINADVERLWQIASQEHADEELEVAKAEFELLLKRHGVSAVRVVSRAILNRLPSNETSWSLLKWLGDGDDLATRNARRDALSAALESRDAGLRYAAASALGSLGGERTIDALRKRLAWEKNVSVRRMIEAQLRS